MALERHCQWQWWNPHRGAEEEAGRRKGSCRQDPTAFLLQCFLELSLLYHGIAHVFFYASCHYNGRLAGDLEFLYKNQEAEAVAIEQCVDMLVTEPQPDEPMPEAHQGMCSGKGNGKGMPLPVPQLDEEDGPMWVKRGWVFGYKLWVGHFPAPSATQPLAVLRRPRGHIHPDPLQTAKLGLCDRHLH